MAVRYVLATGVSAVRRANGNSILHAQISDLALCVFVPIVLMLECSLFFLNIFPSGFYALCSYHNKYLVSVIAVIGVICAFLVGERRGIRAQYVFGQTIAAFCLVCIMMAVVSALFYGTSLRSTMAVAIPFICVPLLYFALHGIVEKERIYDYFISTAIVVATIYSILCLMESFGFDIMNDDYQFAGVRSERLRIIVSGDFVAFGSVLALARFFSDENHRVVYFLACALMVFELYWVAQTRMLLVGIAVAAAFGFIIVGKSKTIKALLVAFVAFLIISVFSSELTAILFPAELEFSSSARENAYPFYFSHVLDMGVFGLGYIPSSSPYSAILEVNRESINYHGAITDIGIVGYIAQYGISGVVLLAIGLVIFVRRFKERDKRTFFLGSNPEAWMLLAFFFTTSLTMAITDSQRIFYLPVIALLVEHALSNHAIVNSGV